LTARIVVDKASSLTQFLKEFFCFIVIIPDCV
jgi:hypothetical protein